MVLHPPTHPDPQLVEGGKAIREKFDALGGILGPPVSGAISGAGGGVFRVFANGTIYWHPAIGAHEVHGAIQGQYTRFGSEASFLGYPITDETGAPDGVGRFNHFQGGSIYFHPAIGAHEVHGAIRDRWVSLGSERSYLGYPVADEADTATGRGRRVAQFQNGSIFSQSTGEMLEAPETAILAGPIVTEETIGGSVQLIINSRGDFAYTGHVRNSGLFGLNVSLVSTLEIRARDGRAFTATEPKPPEESFSVAGSLGAGSRDHDWKQVGTESLLRDNWAAIRTSRMITKIGVGTSVGHVLELAIPAIFLFAVPVFFLTGGTKCSKTCPDGSVVFFECGAPEPNCLDHF